MAKERFCVEFGLALQYVSCIGDQSLARSNVFFLKLANVGNSEPDRLFYQFFFLGGGGRAAAKQK